MEDVEISLDQLDNEMDRQAAIEFAKADVDEKKKLIGEVRKRRILWDYTLPKELLNPADKLAKWQEVARAMGEDGFPFLLRARFNKLLDIFFALKGKEREEWMFYEDLEFVSSIDWDYGTYYDTLYEQQRK